MAIRKNDAALFTAAYFNSTGTYNAKRFFLKDPTIKEMNLHPDSGDIRNDKITAINSAIKLVGFIAQYRFPMHADRTLQQCTDEITEVFLDGDKRASDIVAVIDATFIFLDEV